MSGTALVIVLVVAVAALAVGFVVGGLLVRSRTAGTIATVTSQRDAGRTEVESLRAERDAAAAARAEAEAQVREIEAVLVRTEAQLEHAKQAGEEKLALLRTEQERLSGEFERLSAAALKQNRTEFLQLAGEHLKTSEERSKVELEQRKAAVEALVKPLSDHLGKVETQLAGIERTRAEAYAELREQVKGMSATSEQLRTETSQLVAALRAPQVRGRWGELQLRRVVESAGMLEHVDFSEQASATTADGVLRPDLVVQLAGGKHVVIDSKVSFSGYLEAMESTDEATHRNRLIAHARHLKTHIDQLGAKRYWDQFTPAPEFVIMFVPAEVFLNAALDKDPTLLEHAFAKNVVIATPATLVAMLRTVAYTWRQDALADNAQHVLDLGKELHSRLSTMGGHLAKLGRALDSAVNRYNEGVASLEGRVLVTARKMAELKVTDDELQAPQQVERVARQIQAPELVASAEQALIAIDDLESNPKYGITAGERALQRRTQGGSVS